MAVLLDELHALNRERDRYVDDQIVLARRYNALLKDLDPRLRLVWVNENAVGEDLVPGRWHIRLRTPEGLDIYMAITGPGDSYIEPHSGIIDQLRASDLWDSRRYRDKREAAQRQRAAKRRALELDREQARDEAALAFQAAKRVAGDDLTRRRWGRS